MDRLTQQLARLYGSPDAASAEVRLLVLELARPADWGALAPLWQGVQAELGLPAPAIAVSGCDGYQLWFSLAEARPAAEAQAFLDALRQRWLAELDPQRLSFWPDPQAPQPAPQVPQLREHCEVWSAFVAADLAPVFADTPWLDIPPNLDGQAELLARLRSITPAEWQHARTLLQPAEPEPAPPSASPVPPDALNLPWPPASGGPTESFSDPRQFLLAVMNDPGVALALRIDAARALLPR
ncbi:MAG: hypothetical protein RJA44_1137 [Pseudomonadota bacterium]